MDTHTHTHTHTTAQLMPTVSVLVYITKIPLRNKLPVKTLDLGQ